MTTLTIAPAPAGLDADLDAGAEAVERGKRAASLAGEDAIAFTTSTIYVTSREAVDRIAARWGTQARWVNRYQYVARAGTTRAETLVMWSSNAGKRVA